MEIAMADLTRQMGAPSHNQKMWGWAPGGAPGALGAAGASQREQMKIVTVNGWRRGDLVGSEPITTRK